MKQHLVWGLAVMAATATVACGGRSKSAADIERNRFLEAVPASGNFDTGFHADIDRLQGTAPYKELVSWTKTAEDPNGAEIVRFEAICKKPIATFFHQFAFFSSGNGDGNVFFLARLAVPDAEAKQCIDSVKADSALRGEKDTFSTYDLSNGLLRAGSPALVQASKRGGATSPIVRSLELDGDRVVAMRGLAEGRPVEAYFSASPSALALEGKVELASAQEAEETAKAAPLMMALMGDQKELDLDARARGKIVEFKLTFKASEAKQSALMKTALAKVPQPAPKPREVPASEPIPLPKETGETSDALERAPALEYVKIGDPIARKPVGAKALTSAQKSTHKKAGRGKKRADYLVEHASLFGRSVSELVYSYEETKLAKIAAKSDGIEPCNALRSALSAQFGQPSHVVAEVSPSHSRLEWTSSKAVLVFEQHSSPIDKSCAVNLHRRQ